MTWRRSGCVTLIVNAAIAFCIALLAVLLLWWWMT